ncbi:MAG: DUF2490 domain-containing protein [Candidatus Neomarinimicrobiota bacterium]
MRSLFKKTVIILSLFSMLFAVNTNKTEYRVEGSLRVSLFKNVKFYLIPELRFNNNGLDESLTEAELKYSPLKNLDLGLSYRLTMDHKSNKPTEYIHRYSVFSAFEHEIGRFLPSLKIMFSNYNGDNNLLNLLRYKANLEYDIPKLKVDPFLSAELFHQLENSTIYKIRYGLGADWRFIKDQSIGLSYKLDNYLNENKIKHIITLDYSYKF